MEAQRRDQLKRSLRLLAQSQATLMKLFEEIISLLSAEASLDPRTYFEQYKPLGDSVSKVNGVQIDQQLLAVHYQGKSCFLGSTISFRLLKLLIERANTFVTHEVIFECVWTNEDQSPTALRSAIKILRKKLRSSGLDYVADAIKGSQSGHYNLHLS